MHNKSKRIIPLIILLLAAAGYGAYTVFQSAAQSKGFVASGTIEAKEVHLGVPSGGIVERIYVDEGDRVSKGQTLATVKENSSISSGIIRAPMDGVVLLRAVEPGEITTAGGTMLVIADLSEMTLVFYIPEDRYGRVNLGQEYPVTVDSFPGQVFMGKVTYIANQAEFTPRNVQTAQGRKNTVFAIRLTIPNPHQALKPGMPADVTLEIR